MGGKTTVSSGDVDIASAMVWTREKDGRKKTTKCSTA